MKTILVTGAHGFIGRNLCLALRRVGDFEVIEIDREHTEEELAQAVAAVDAVVHLAGINRPESDEEFVEGNVNFTQQLCDLLKATNRKIPIVCSSSIQAELDNPYGASKRGGEQVIIDYQSETGSPVYVYRLPNVFGKWSKPNYNTVVATFCHNISRDIPVQINDASVNLSFCYVDDVVAKFIDDVSCGNDNNSASSECGILEFEPAYGITLGELYELIVSFKDSRQTLKLANFGDPLTKYLYTTYLSFLDREDFAYPVDLKTDDRGWLFELIKSETAGQMFVSSTKPGITRGNHYHDTKVEKFCVVKGQGVIRFRHVFEKDVFEYAVDDQEIKVVDIPPGHTHSIENTGDAEMITLFWVNEIFDHERMDTYFEQV